MAYVREALSAHIQDNINAAVTNRFTTYSAIWAMLGAAGVYDRKNPYKGETAGRPTAGRFLGCGAGMSTAQKMETLGSSNHQIRFVKAEPNDGGSVAYGGNYPTAAAYAEDNFGTAEFRWGHYVEPVEMRKDSLMMAKGETAVKSLADESTKPALERMFKRVTQDFWTGSLSGTQQNAQIWGGNALTDSGVLGLQHQVGSGNVFGRVDRAVETSLNANVWAASTQIGTSTTVELEMIRAVQLGFTRADTSAEVEGIATKTSTGIGADCVVAGAALFRTLAAEADGRYEITTNGIPNSALAGFKGKCINFDDTYIVLDPKCPAGEMYLTTMDSWSLEIQKGKDFMFSGLNDNTKLQRGGPAVEWGHFEFVPRLICHQPHLQTKITGLTANI